MYFVIRYTDGYEVCVVMMDDKGFVRTFPMRNFGQRQGDAMMFKYHDCPKFDLSRVNSFIKSYDVKRKYERLDESNFRVVEVLK